MDIKAPKSDSTHWELRKSSGYALTLLNSSFGPPSCGVLPKLLFHMEIFGLFS